MKQVECSNCGALARVARGSYRFRESGLRVVLQGIELVRCKKCGNEDPILPQVNDLMRLLAVAVVCRPSRLRGEDIRFLRKYLRMTGDEFSRMLHVDRTTLSKWENNDDRIGVQSDRLIRTLALALGEGLKDKLEEVVRSFPEIRDTSRPAKIEINPETMSYQYV